MRGRPRNPTFRGAWRGSGLSDPSGLFGLSGSADKRNKIDQTDQTTFPKFVVRRSLPQRGVNLHSSPARIRRPLDIRDLYLGDSYGILTC